MNHDDHVRLISRGVKGTTGPWADLGAGDGAFTLALADLLAPGTHIYAVDRDQKALDRLRRAMSERFPQTRLDCVHADFTMPLELRELHGVVMANSLHFQRNKQPVLELVSSYMRPRGRLVVVEYNAERGNWWVPHPFSYPTWQELAREASFEDTALLETVPSRFLGEIYSAVSVKP